MRVPKTFILKKKKHKRTKKIKPKTRGRENEQKIYLIVTCWIAYMYNVALNIKAPSTHIWIFLRLHIFFITRWPSLNTKRVNPPIHLRPIHVKKYVVSNNIQIVWMGPRGYKLVPEGPEGLGNCSFDPLAELCCDVSSRKTNLSLTIKKSTRNNCY